MVKKVYTGERQDLLNVITIMPGASVLDVGCAGGELGEILKIRYNVETVGIELNPELAESARNKLDSVYVGDAETMHLPFPREYFDVLIFADSLEHMKDPWGTLVNYRKYLKHAGYLVLSIPNIRRFRIILSLLMGRFTYTDYGLMDYSHLHFFTLHEIRRMLNYCGFKLLSIDRNKQARLPLKIANIMFFNKLKEFMVYQYLVQAIKQLEHP